MTIASLFLAGGTIIVSGLVFKVFGTQTLSQFFKDSNQIPIITDRYSVLNEIDDS